MLLALAVSLLIGLGVFDTGLRLLGLGPPKVLNRFDAALGWSKQPGLSVHRRTGEFDVTFELNELGLRDDVDLTIEKPDDTYRVVVLGDSFALGYTVERADLFVDQLERRWNAEGRRVQVVNTGSEGYSTDQEVAWLETHGAAWEPDLVLLFSYDNDIFYNGETHYLRFPKPRYEPNGALEQRTLEDPGPRGFLRRTALGNLLLPKERLKTFRPAAAERDTLCEFAPLFHARPDFIADAEARTVGALRGLERLSRALGCEVVVVPIPSHSSVDGEYAETFQRSFLGVERSAWDPDRPVQLVLDGAKTAGLPALDARAHLRAAHAVEPLFFTKDFHLNAAGNRAFADFLHEKLISQGDYEEHAGAGGTADFDGVIVGLPDRSPGARGAAVAAAERSAGMPGWLPWYLGLWLVVGCAYATYYRADERAPLAFLKVGALLGVVFCIAIGGKALIDMLPPDYRMLAFVVVIAVILGFVVFKLGDRISTIAELVAAFIGRGHWYLMPVLVVLLTVGSLLVVAASSPLVAPFIYTLF